MAESQEEATAIEESLENEQEDEPVKEKQQYEINMNKLVQHIWEAIRFENTESIIPIFDNDRPICSTGNMQMWYTGRPCEYTKRSHINFFR